MKTQEQLEWERQCYGMTQEELVKSIEESVTFRLTGIGMVMMSMMSDMQEMVLRNGNGGYDEDIRQALNRCKFFTHHYKLGMEPRGAVDLDAVDALCYRKLRAVLGHVENGTDTILTVFQDDATREYIVRVRVPLRHGEKSYGGASLGSAIDAAYASVPEENKI